MTSLASTEHEQRDSLGSRRKLGKTRIRPVLQMERADCGAACLTMVLSQHGKHLPLSRVRGLLDGGRDGVTALDIVRAARHFGLSGGGFAAPLELLEQLPAGTILHWERVHFVVLLHADPRGALILDPARGRRRVDAAELERCYSGVALVFEPGEAFVREGKPSLSLARPLLTAVWESGRWGRIALNSLVLQLFGLGLPVLLGVLVDRVVPHHDRSLWSLVGWATAALLVVHPIIALARGRLLLTMRSRIDAALGYRLMGHLMRLPYSFFIRRAAGDLMMRLQSNLAIRQILSSAALSALMDASLVLTYSILLAWVEPRMAGLVLLLSALQLAVFMMTRRRRRELLSRAQAAHAAKSEFEAQLLGNMETVKSAGAEQRAEQRWRGLFDESLRIEEIRAELDAICDAIAGSLRVVAPVIVLLYGVDQVLDGSLTLGQMLGLNALAVASLAPITGLVTTAGQLALLGGYLERIDDVLQTAPEREHEQVRPAPTLSGAITLEQVGFRHSPLLDETLVGLNLDIPAGSFVAVVGPSGAGKSTLARTLAGLHVPTSGRVLYDGLDLATLDLGEVRRRIGVVLQRPELLGTTLLDALRFASPDASEEQVIAACERAAIHDEIVALPMGYRTGLASGGPSFSGGQTQRLALARALVANPHILILDEATSALDAVTEARVQAALDALHCTRIVFAHRLSTIRRADRIVVMQRGRIVECGTHEQLLALGGAYAELMATQIEANREVGNDD